MLFTSASRAVVRRRPRPSPPVQRMNYWPSPVRQQSSATSQATQAASSGASKAADAASAAASQASRSLARVTGAAGPILSGAARRASSILRGIGGRTGRMISFVDSMIPPAIYYSKVGVELAKMVFHTRKMSPPSLAQFQAYFQPLIHHATHPGRALSAAAAASGDVLHPVRILRRLRAVSSQELGVVAVVSAELLGFFTVGEMLGRFKLVGYRGEPGAGAHHH